MGVLLGFTIGLVLRLLIWAARMAFRLVADHPVTAIVLLLLAAAEGWIGEQLFMWALLGLTLWAVLSVLANRFPSSRRAAAPPSVTHVWYGDGPRQVVEHRDALDQVSARDRRRFERARRRHERQLADAGIGDNRRARRRRRERSRS
jgi:hypothetical protein